MPKVVIENHGYTGYKVYQKMFGGQFGVAWHCGNLESAIRLKRGMLSQLKNRKAKEEINNNQR